MVKVNRVSTNIPAPLNNNMGGGSLAFPNDLRARTKNGQRPFFTRISFQNYSMGGIPRFFGGGGMGGSITLPIPRKINDVNSVIWEQISGVSAGLGAASALNQGVAAGMNAAKMAADAGNILMGSQGVRLNPHLLMLFKQPNFKEYTFNWALAPNSEDETQSIAAIVRAFKNAMMPSIGTYVYEYPQIAKIQFYPNEEFLMKTKPAAIMAVQADYTGSGQPSFFKSGGPTVVNLTVTFREIELWSSGEM